jgi:hypothetical protein
MSEKKGHVKSETEFLGIIYTLKDGSKKFVPTQKDSYTKEEVSKMINENNIIKP